MSRAGTLSSGPALAGTALLAPSLAIFAPHGLAPLLAVLAGDSEDKLAARILRQEHRLYPLVVRWFGEGRVSLADGRVEVKGVKPGATLLFSAEP